MTRRVIRGAVVLLLALAQVLMGGMGRFGVLCYGADGHVAFEANASLCCASLQASQSHPALLAASVPQASPADGDQCGSCLDVTFPSTTSQQPRQISGRAVALAPTTLPASLLVSAGLRSRTVPMSSSHCRVESIQFAQTVLRI